jgi:zinc/manganese transport system ATP-binding protein
VLAFGHLVMSRTTSVIPETPASGELLVDATAPRVVLESVSVQLGSHTIWSEANMSLPAGGVLAVLGPNGAGKSTLLRVLLGLVPISRGSVRVLGAAPRRGNADIGYVPQRRPLEAELPLRAADFVRFGVDGDRWGVMIGTAQRRRLHEAVARALAEVGATQLADRALGTLSGGEQQRLFLAQALARNPRLLLLDEPLASLDVRNQAAIVQLVADVARRHGIAVIMVTHDVNPVLSYVDQVMYVARGRVVVGEPEAIIRADVLSSMYGTPVDVLTDRRGRIFVVGLENETAHPHEDHSDH